MHDEDDDAFSAHSGHSSDSNSSRTSSPGPSRPSSARPSRGVSLAASGEGDTPAGTPRPGGSDNEDEVEEGEIGEEVEGGDGTEPAEVGSDLDPINSGAVTPGVPGVVQPVQVTVKAEKVRSQFAPKRKETKVIKGQVYTVIDDEIQLEDDPRGEAKMDSDGNLLGGPSSLSLSLSSLPS
ncbi:hypothetical protein P7C70_g5907, partial [Phenoliferia sp. Uapishka_3]